MGVVLSVAISLFYLLTESLLDGWTGNSNAGRQLDIPGLEREERPGFFLGPL